MGMKLDDSAASRQTCWQWLCDGGEHQAKLDELARCKRILNKSRQRRTSTKSATS